MNLSEIQLTPRNFTTESLEVLRQCKSLKDHRHWVSKDTDRLAVQGLSGREFDVGGVQQVGERQSFPTVTQGTERPSYPSKGVARAAEGSAQLQDRAGTAREMNPF